MSLTYVWFRTILHESDFVPIFLNVKKLQTLEDIMSEHILEEMQRLNYLLSEINAAYHEASQRLGLSDSTMQVLYVVCNYGESCLLSEICKLSGTSKQTINSALRKRVGEGGIRLEPLTGKRKKVCLTEKGKTIANETVARLIEIENTIFDSWTNQEQELYLALTQRYLISLKDEIKKLSV